MAFSFIHGTMQRSMLEGSILLYRTPTKIGCYFYREGGRHEIWYSPITGKQFQLGRHNTQEVAIGTLKNIKKDAGLE